MAGRTIGKHWPKTAEFCDYTAKCDYCDVLWRRSQLTRDGAGFLRCPDEGDGLDRVTLDEMNLEGALEEQRRAAPGDNDRGQYPTVDDTAVPLVTTIGGTTF
jgi:hypothetical protein